MRMCVKLCVPVLAMAVILSAAGWPANAQEKRQHVVSLDQLNKDAAKPAETRHANEEAIRSLLSSDAGQKALKSAKVNYAQVDKAIGQLSDEDAAKLGERSRQAQMDFAAGHLTDRDLLIIILVIVGLIVLIIAVR